MPGIKKAKEQFDKETINPNLLSVRAAMGIEESLVDRLSLNVFADNSDLFKNDVSTLVSVLDSCDTSMPRRYVAGMVLALKGDTRIDPLNPPMVSLPALEITIGTKADDLNRVVSQWEHAGVIREWITKECPIHKENITGFSIGKYPVTNYEYYCFLAATKSKWLPSSWILGQYPVYLANHPVWTIPPEAADAYATWLSGQTGRKFRLPTEKEWEYAAAGEHAREYPWGNEFNPLNVNTVERGPLGTTPIGMYSSGKTPSGIYDLGGNVEEYTSDNYSPYPGGAHIDDDLSITQGKYRVARGGSFTRYGDLTRCSRRHGWFKSDLYVMGFRLAETL